MDIGMSKWDNIRSDKESVAWPTVPIVNLQEKMKTENPVGNSPECNRCWTQETLGVNSYRQHYEEIFRDTIDTDFDKYILSPELKFLDIQFGYLCNLSCAMCAPSLSSNLQVTRKKMIAITSDNSQRKIYEKQLNVFDNQDWTVNDVAYGKLKELCLDITSMKISGGEPFFNPRFKDFLEFLIKKDKPIQFLHIVTNGTIYDKDIVNLLNSISKVEFRFSLESTEKEDEFIRWPGNWDDKNSNMLRYLNELKTSKFFANVCMQSLNLFSFQNTIDYLNSLPHNIEILHNVLSFTDMASLWHSDKDYIRYYLDSDMIKNTSMTEHAKKALIFERSNYKMQSVYFKDLATVQKKDLEKEFPVWFKFHAKYLSE